MPIAPEPPEPNRPRSSRPSRSGSPPIPLPDPVDSSDDIPSKPISRRKRRTSMSRIGLLGEIAALIALLLCRKTILPAHFRHLDPVWPAVVGIALAILALVGSVLGSRAGKGVPFLAILFSLAAIGIAAYQSGVRNLPQAHDWVMNEVQTGQSFYNNKVARFLPHSAPTAPAQPEPTRPPAAPAPTDPFAATPSSAPPTPASAVPSVSPAGSAAQNPDQTIGAGTIFDMRRQSSARPDEPAASSGAPDSSAQSPQPVPQFKKGPSPQLVAAQNVLADAQFQSKSAEDAFRARFEQSNSGEYTAAKAALDDAQQQVDSAKQGGGNLMEALNKRLAAQQSLNSLANTAMQKDPAVLAARQKVAAAQAAVIAAQRGE